MRSNNTPLYGIFSRGLGRLKDLEILLGAPTVRCIFKVPPGLTATLGWGRSKYSERARRVAEEKGIPFFRLEDGFLRSVGLGSQDPPLSIVFDDLGIYYDATTASRLEALISREHQADEICRAQRLIEAWRMGRVSKYNHAREGSDVLSGESFVLVVDQTLGDASIQFGLANEDSFSEMLQAALDENPERKIVLKVHPDVVAKRKRGHFDHLTPGQASRVQILGTDIHSAGLLERAETVYTVTSQMGFEGLMWNKPVRTFGMPFYAGWGLTQDELPAPDRRKTVNLTSLVHAALIEYPRYLDPEKVQRCEIERVLEWMALQRRMRERFGEQLYALDFSRWKKPIVQSFFQGSKVDFGKHFPKRSSNNSTVVLWGCKPFPGDKPESMKILRLEDGFLRSVGLGADLVRPLSWVIDEKGIYYDSTRPSDLECLLETTQFDNKLLIRAKTFRERLVATKLTKYNVGAKKCQWPSSLWHGIKVFKEEKKGKPIILVPGQVESDASLAFGAPCLNRNIDLLRTVREKNPDAYVIYKPHPDVVARLRKKGEGEENAIRWCDQMIVDVSMGDLLTKVDEVHTLTSLTGFEALLRGKKVVCYGQPFYAGWGLTEDRLPVARRSRRLNLDELVAGVLLIYPAYVSRVTNRFTTPEGALEELLAWQKFKTVSMPWWRKPLRWSLQQLKR